MGIFFISHSGLFYQTWPFLKFFKIFNLTSEIEQPFLISLDIKKLVSQTKKKTIAFLKFANNFNSVSYRPFLINLILSVCNLRLYKSFAFGMCHYVKLGAMGCTCNLPIQIYYHLNTNSKGLCCNIRGDMNIRVHLESKFQFPSLIRKFLFHSSLKDMHTSSKF